MKAVQRIEIVVDAPHAARVIALLATQGIVDYTRIRGVSGSGDRGPRRGDEVSGVSDNHYILTTCAPENLAAVVSALRPLLEEVGGMCLVSEARWVLH